MTAILINPRKSPKQARAKATVAAILQATARILDRDGLEKFNTNRVAEVAGVSIGTLYQYFPTKEAILTDIIRQKRAQLLSGLTAAIQEMQQETFEQTLSKLIHAAIEHQLEWPKLARTLEYAEAFLPLEKETADLNVAITNTVVKFLAQHEIDAPDQNATDLVAALRGMIDGAGLAGEIDKDSLFHRSMRLATGYLK